MSKIKIYVACHKPCDVLQDEVYTPIHVGRTLSKYKEEMAEMVGDNTGDNISEKNPLYSEMTAQYWAWKNVHDCEFIGFCHYRRTFQTHFSNNCIEDFFSDGTDVIVVGPILRLGGRYNFLKTFVCGEDLAIMLLVIKKLYPEYYITLSDYANGYIDYPLNMFICRKSLFDEYATWIFNILFECEKHIKLSPYSRARRVYGYLSEFLMPIFFMHQKCNIKEIKYNYLGDKIYTNGGISIKTTFKMKFIDFLLYRNHKSLIEPDPSIIQGLQSDSNNVNLFN